MLSPDLADLHLIMQLTFILHAGDAKLAIN
jgi:hypothetical protein